MKVDLIDTMGNDITVVNAARVSFSKESDWEWEWNNDVPVSGPHLSEKDQKLIKYLATHNHWTPFSHVMIQMRETVPIFVARQRFKHMVGFTYNEVSRRYVDDTPEFFYPSDWRKRAESKKQGSSDEVITEFENMTYHFMRRPDDKPVNTPYISEAVQHVYNEIRLLYTALLDSGVAPEQARMVLPQSMYTSYYVTGSLAAWARAYNQRSDEHAQKEIQQIAKMWDDNIRSISELKHSWEALVS